MQKETDRERERDRKTNTGTERDSTRNRNKEIKIQKTSTKENNRLSAHFGPTALSECSSSKSDDSFTKIGLPSPRK